MPRPDDDKPRPYLKPVEDDEQIRQLLLPSYDEQIRQLLLPPFLLDEFLEDQFGGDN